MIFEEMLKEEREEGREEGRSVLKETLLSVSYTHLYEKSYVGVWHETRSD